MMASNLGDIGGLHRDIDCHSIAVQKQSFFCKSCIEASSESMLLGNHQLLKLLPKTLGICLRVSVSVLNSISDLGNSQHTKGGKE